MEEQKKPVARYRPALQEQVRQQVNFYCRECGMQLKIFAQVARVSSPMMLYFVEGKRNLDRKHLENLMAGIANIKKLLGGVQ